MKYPHVTLSQAAVESVSSPSLLDVMRQRLHEALLANDSTFQPGDTVTMDTADLDPQRNAVTVRVSREMALDFGIVEPTDAERAERAAAAAEWAEASARRRAEPGPPLTLDALLDLLGWDAAYAAHRLHPECHCSTTDWYLCDFAQAEGFTYDDLGRTP
jgi:hypothetical protein